MAWSVILFYLALVFWVCLLIWSARRRSWRPFFVFGLVMTVLLNGRYIVEGMVGGISYFVGIFDVVVHVGASAGSGKLPAVITTCPNNACTVWGDTYVNHSSWAVAFYERFKDGPMLRTALLYGHLTFNTIALILVTVQIVRPGGQNAWHKTLGRIAYASVVISIICAGLLNSELGTVREYGARWTQFGLYFLSLTVLVPATMGVAAIMRGDVALHRVWMWRFAGALWGSYWIFRAEMLLVDLLVRDVEGLTLAIPSWTAGLIGIAIAEYIRMRLDNKRAAGSVHQDREVVAAQ